MVSFYRCGRLKETTGKRRGPRGMDVDGHRVSLRGWTQNPEGYIMDVDGPRAMNLKGRPLSGEPEAMNLKHGLGDEYR